MIIWFGIDLCNQGSVIPNNEKTKLYTQLVQILPLTS